MRRPEFSVESCVCRYTFKTHYRRIVFVRVCVRVCVYFPVFSYFPRPLILHHLPPYTPCFPNKLHCSAVKNFIDTGHACTSAAKNKQINKNTIHNNDFSTDSQKYIRSGHLISNRFLRFYESNTRSEIVFKGFKTNGDLDRGVRG